MRQSTLSRRLRDLELRVGVLLFERTNGGTRPTNAGLDFLEFAHRILGDTDNALRTLRGRSRGESGRLTIGVYASLATGNLHATLVDYHRRFPGVDIHLVDGPHARLICALDRNDVDVAIMTNWRSDWHDRDLPLWTERVIVALPEQHPLIERDAVNWHSLANERLLFPRNGPGPELEGLFATKINGDRPHCSATIRMRSATTRVRKYGRGLGTLWSGPLEPDRIRRRF